MSDCLVFSIFSRQSLHWEGVVEDLAVRRGQGAGRGVVEDDGFRIAEGGLE